MNWAGSTSSSADEWLELYNNSNNDIDLSEYQISLLTSSGEKYIALSGVIKSQDYFLVANNDKDYSFKNGQSVLNIDPDFTSSSLSLSNSELYIRLLKNNLDNLEEIDSIGDNNDPFFGSTEPYRSMQRIGIKDGLNSESFQSSYVCINLENCDNNFGTPKAKNIFIPEIKLLNNQVNYEINKDYIFQFENIFVDNDQRDLEVKLNYSNQEISAQKTQDDIINFSFNYNKTSCDNLLFSITDQYNIEKLIENRICFFKKFDNLEIKEILANPNNDENEYVKLFNNSNEIIDLENYYIDDKDGGSQPYQLNNLTILPKKNYQLLLNNKIILNDSGDEVRILDPNLTEILKIIFKNSGDGEVLCQKNDYLKCQYKNLSNIIISSILPDPKTGEEEEITIENLSQQSVDLNNYYLKDKSGKKFTFQNKIINNKEKIVLKYNETKINLNNSGFESLTLFNYDNEILSKLEYEKAREGLRYFYQNNQYIWEEEIDQNISDLNNVSDAIISLDSNNNQNISVAKSEYKNNQLIEKYQKTDVEIKGVKNIDKESKNSYNNILVLSIFGLSTLWKLILKTLIKV
ncbi:MAG: hypothetical protein UR93_C0002G0007 [Berkelbacteria bacterium GW2011_GWA2_35_9]|uniref:LTD domain-containing protein n=1 Tax=Berkelbacteria bacterium GW2011_GWA2_35_9 TaxID=1618333 RepID=A0A0G0FNX2_9BACT|nr:MAG: hypothetical protein UR93_C0002G0007 [Berkelbacteria bacterium GW2011_GWA2_35_9]